MLEISGAEGGGQLLRTALSLSLCTGTPFRMRDIRASRPKPGLMRQHLTAVEAARVVGGASVTGATPGSLELLFVPQAVRAGDYSFAIGTAGSTTLVLQTILPPLWQAAAPSSVFLEGGTHNPMAPPADFLTHAFAPMLRRLGVEVEIKLERYGFFPAGGGALRARVSPGTVQPLSLLERGVLRAQRARAVISAIPSVVADRELEVVARRLGLGPAELEHRSAQPAFGPGNALMVFMEFEGVSEVFTGFGERGTSAETVGERVCDRVKSFLDSDAALGPHLADQALLPLALAGSGTFSTQEPTDHLLTNAALIEKFVAVEVEVRPDASRSGRWVVKISS